MKDFLIRTAYAQGGFSGPDASSAGVSTFDVVFNKIIVNVVNPVIYFVIALAFVLFLYGVFMFIKNADDAEKRKEGQSHMFWGIVGLFIMLSVRGIIYIILSSMGL